MPSQYERVDRRRPRGPGGYGYTGTRTTLGYWMPLVLTVTVATIGLAAWIWSERSEDEDESSADEQYPGGVPPPGYASMSGGLPPEPVPGSFEHDAPPGAEGYTRSVGVDGQEDGTLLGKMSSAIRRAPSPQLSYDWASKKVAAGVAAAGAMVGGALSSIREDSQDAWSEEADSRDREPKPGPKRRGTAHEFFEGQVEMPKIPSITKKRKSVAIVVSAVEHDDSGHSEVGRHASILSHLPHHVDHNTTRIFVLIYTPTLSHHPLSTSSISGSRVPASIASSFSNIGHEEARTPGEISEAAEGPSGSLSNLEPRPVDEQTPLFKTLYNQSLALVEKDSMIFPFTTATGYLHILRSLAPETVYVQETLCGDDGEIVQQLSGWVKQVVIVVGDEGGMGGLVDSEDEAGVDNTATEEKKWWTKEERTGVGRGMGIVEGGMVGEDWRRRVGEVD